MKPFYCAFLLFLFFFCGNGTAKASVEQPLETGNTCETALEAQEGANMLPEGVFQQSVWYRFVMPRNGRIHVSGASNNIDIYKNDCENLQFLDAPNRSGQASNLIAGETYYIRLYTYGEGSNQNWTISLYEDQPGDYCHSAFEAQIGANVEPEGSLNHFWLKVVMPDNGNLAVSSDYGLAVEIYGQDCENLVKITEGLGYDPVIAEGLTAGQTYYLKCYAWGKPVVWLLEVDSTEPGEVCWQAIEADEGENSVPENFNPYYWYKVSLQEDGKIKIRFWHVGSVLVYKGECDNLTEVGESAGTANTGSSGDVNSMAVPLAGVVEVTEEVIELEGRAGDEFYLKFDTSQGGNFSWAYEKEPTGGSCETAVSAGEGENTIPLTDYPEYWYRFGIPREGRLILTSETSLSVVVYGNGCGSLEILNSDAGNTVIAGLNAGEEIFIQWPGDAGRTISWNLAIEPHGAGDVCSVAADAVEGKNQLPRSPVREYWYKYTSPKAGDLSITSETSNPVMIYGSECAWLNMKGSGAGNVQVNNLSAGEEVLIKWEKGYDDSFEWHLEAPGSKVGGECSVAVEAVAGTNLIPATDFGNYWYRFEMPFKGTINLRSTKGRLITTYGGSCEALTMRSSGNDLLKLSNLAEGTFLWITGAASPTESSEFSIQLQQYQEITFDKVEDQFFSTGSIVLSASSSSALPVQFELVSGPATLVGNELNFTSAGPVTMRAF